MIKPTVGRIVHYFAPSAPDNPLAAIVVAVNGDRNVNLAVFNPDGGRFRSMRTQLLQDNDAAPANAPYAAWMEYQKGQAAKYDKLAEQLQPGAETAPAPVTEQSAPDPVSSLQVSDALGASVAVAPRVTLADIEGAVSETYYFTAEQAVCATNTRVAYPSALKLLTICILVMQNGFVVIGKSAPASPENFDTAVGQKFAREDAVRQLWPLMGFALRDRLAASQA